MKLSITTLALFGVVAFAFVEKSEQKKPFFPGFTNAACRVTSEEDGEVYSSPTCPGDSTCSLGPLLVSVGKADKQLSVEAMFCDELDDEGNFMAVSTISFSIP